MHIVGLMLFLASCAAMVWCFWECHTLSGKGKFSTPRGQAAFLGFVVSIPASAASFIMMVGYA